MDNKKTGKLIAELRNKNNLTQQELGDKIGVGFRAVSKWECGQTLPDIANMKELSKIFGITLDELIEGKLNTTKKKLSKNTKIALIISSTIIFISLLTVLVLNIFNNQNKNYVYRLSSVDVDNYKINGQITFNEENTSISISELKFYEESMLSTKIINYEYKVLIDNQQLIGYGYSMLTTLYEEGINIDDFSENFEVNTNIETEYTRKDFVNKGLTLNINFIDENNQIISQSIKIKLTKIK